MAHSIGKTIAELRKAKGWTQVQLAEKLGVSDKAVSKWESEGGFPEVTQFPVLASIFDVSIDYLMTGKKDEPTISLDDMDSQKRMFYLIQRDDVENYLKYGYEKETYFNDFPRESRPDVKTPILAIIENGSFKIFNACVRAGIKVMSDYTRKPPLVDALYACVGHFDMLVRFACLAGCVDFLEQIQFRTFAVGNNELNNKRTNTTYYSHTYHTYEESTAYLISEKTIDTIFNNENVPSNVIEYVCTYVPFDPQKVYETSGVRGKICGKFYFLEQVIVEQLYRTGRYELLDRYLKSLAEDSFKTVELFSNFDRRMDHNNGIHNFISPSSYLIRASYGSTTVEGKVITISSNIIHLAISNLDEKYTNMFVDFNKSIADKISIDGFNPFVPDSIEIECLFEETKREKRILAIQNDTTISDHERRCKLAKEHALSFADTIAANDYDAFLLLPEYERNKIEPEYLSKNNIQDIRFYVYAVNVSNNTECLNKGLKNILEKFPKRYDIQDVLLSAGAIIDGNIAMTNILKQMILNKQENADISDVEINESVTKQQLLKKIESNQLEYVIVNANLQMEKRLKLHIKEQIDLNDMINKALNMRLIDASNCKLLHNLRRTRNKIVHEGKKSYYTDDVVKMWVEAVYSIK